MKLIYTSENNSLTIRMNVDQQDQSPILKLLRLFKQNHNLNPYIKQEGWQDSDYIIEIISANGNCFKEILDVFLVIKNNFQDSDSEEILINNEPIDNAIQTFCLQYFGKLNKKKLITDQEMEKIQILNEKPEYIISDALPPGNLQDPEEAQNLSCLIIFYSFTLNTAYPEIYKTITWKIEWLFVVYLRCLFNSDDLLENDNTLKCLNLVTNILSVNTKLSIPVKNQEILFNNTNCSFALLEYYKSLIKQNKIECLNKYLHTEKYQNANCLAFTGIYKRNDMNTIRYLINNNCITPEYQLGSYNYTLLLFAFSMNKVEIANELLQMEANLFARTTIGDSPINILISHFRSKTDPEIIEKSSKLLELIFSQKNMTITKLLILYSEMYKNKNIPNEYYSEYNLDSLFAFFKNEEKYIRDLIINKSSNTTIMAFFTLYSDRASSNFRNFLLHFAEDPLIGKDIILKLMNSINRNLFNRTIKVSNEEDENKSAEDLIYIDYLVDKNPLLIKHILMHYTYSKQNIIDNSPFHSVLETKVTKATPKKIIYSYSLTYVLINAPSKVVSEFFYQTKLPFGFVAYNESYSIIKIKMDSASFINFINLYSPPNCQFISLDQHIIKKPPQYPSEFYKTAAQLLTKPALSFMSMLAANPIRKSVGSSLSLMQISKLNVKKQITNFNASCELFYEVLTKNFSTSNTDLNSLTVRDIEDCVRNLLNIFITSDFDLLHATRNYHELTQSKIIHSTHTLEKKFIHKGMTSHLDDLFGGYRYVYCVLNTSEKPFPPELKDYYGNVVFTFPLNAVLEKEYDVCLKTSDWYYYALERTQKISCGLTEIEVIHHPHQDKVNNYKEERYRYGETAKVQKIDMLDEFFMNQDIAVGLGYLVTNKLMNLDPKSQCEILEPFLSGYDEILTKNMPELSIEQRKETIFKKQRESIDRLHGLLPACEGTIANRVILEPNIVANIKYLTPPKKALPAISYYQEINEIYLAIDQEKNNEAIKALILKYKQHLNIPHALNKITLLVKAMLHNNFEIMKFLLENGADPNQVSAINKHSSQYTPLMITIILKNLTGFQILLNFNANSNEIIYDHNGVADYQSNNVWDQPISSAYIINMFRKNFLLDNDLETFKLPIKKLLVFIATTSDDNRHILLCRKGYKFAQNLVAHGEWLLPAVLVNENPDYNDTLEYLSGIEMGETPIDVTAITEFEIKGMDAVYQISVVGVDLTHKYFDIPPTSEHFAQMQWRPVINIIIGQVDNLPISVSNLELIKNYLNLKNSTLHIKLFQDDLEKNYLLHQAIITGNIDEVKHLVINKQVSANAKVSMLHPITYQWFEGCTPLMTVALYADKKCYNELVTILIQHGADLSVADKKGKLIIDHGSFEFLEIVRKVIREFQLPILNSELYRFVSEMHQEKRSLTSDDYEATTILKIPRH